MSHIFVFFYQNTVTVTKQVKPLRLMVSTKSAHLLPDNSLEAFNGFYCTSKPVKFRRKHFNSSDKEKGFPIYWSWDVSSLTLKEIGHRIHPQARFSLPVCLNDEHYERGTL